MALRNRPRLLDLFCGAGGAAMGYHQAGFEVIGVDIKPQPHYPFRFIEADALNFMVMENACSFYDFDVIHASPPCQLWAEVAQGRKGKHPDLLTPTRELLKLGDIPYVIENVPPAPMPDSFILCGAAFGLPIIRHRRFEWTLGHVLVPNGGCPQTRFNRAVDHGPGFYPYARKKWETAWREHVLPVVWPWMDLDEAGQAIPPAYTEWIGTQLMEALKIAA